ncbi:MAG: EpsI family protein [Candidatus Omnitrophica bacterium]|nr:EpsI family protein [Candidatus Omnitrophota bacterium]
MPRPHTKLFPNVKKPKFGVGARVLAFLSLAACAWLVWAGDMPSATSQQAAPVPDRLGLWEGKPLEVEDRTVEILETDDVSLMEYRLGQEPPVWFAQVAGFGTRAAFHPPELCYVGSHYQVADRGPISVIVNGKVRDVMRLVVTKGTERFEAWYWFTADDRVTPSYYQQQLWLAADSIRRRPMSGTLVRISTPLEHPERARRRLLAFVASWDNKIIQDGS